jgi:CcmD family protein
MPSMPRLLQLLSVTLIASIASGPLAELAAQAGDANSIGGMRAYWHVFIAYAIAILFVLGWVISIGKRLKDIQERLGK